MTLLVNELPNLQGRPGVHALIVGVSAYRFLPTGNQAGTPESLGLRQLSSTALSAYRVFRWLESRQQNLPLPLATCRVLLSPSAEETVSEPALAGLAQAATLENFLREARDWRQDAAGNEENMTFFYFAGHGAQRTREDGVILLEDFGDGLGGPLKNAVDVGNIFKGMAKSNAFPSMAQTQLYFVDACRDFLTSFRNYEPDDATQVFRVQLTGEDRRRAPIFFAAAPGTRAYARIGEQTLFSQALLECLSNDAADFKELNGQERWCVSVHSLSEALTQRIADLNELEGADQEIVVGGLGQEAVISYLDGAPSVRVVLEVEPPEAMQVTRLEVLDDQGGPGPQLPFPLEPHPYSCTWPAGFYTIHATISPPDARYVDRPGRARPVMPPRYPKKVRVTP